MARVYHCVTIYSISFSLSITHSLVRSLALTSSEHANCINANALIFHIGQFLLVVFGDLLLVQHAIRMKAIREPSRFRSKLEIGI